MDGYDLECITKDAVWYVSFGVIPVIGVCNFLSLVFSNPLRFYLPLRKKLLRDLILFFLCSFSMICVVQVIINESGVCLGPGIYELNSTVNL